MKVYVVSGFYDHEGYELPHGVFSTLGLASKYIADQSIISATHRPNRYEIEEYVIDIGRA